MTPKQSDFIRSLASERVLPEGAQGDYVRKLVAGTAREPDTGQASRIIEWLLELPRQQTPEAGDVPAGRYALVHPENGHIEFFVVDKPDEGRWAGYTFVSQQASDDKYPVKGARRGQVLARIAEDPQAAMIRYGHELGRCGNCGRTLTDEVSRAMGIGPDCAAKLGIERIAGGAALEINARLQGDPQDAEDYAFGGYDRADVAAEEQAEKAETTGWDALDESKGDGRDKKNVPYGAGDWRGRKAYMDKCRSDDKPGKAALKHEQLTELPGETFEDIFRKS